MTILGRTGPGARLICQQWRSLNKTNISHLLALMAHGLGVIDTWLLICPAGY